MNIGRAEIVIGVMVVVVVVLKQLIVAMAGAVMQEERAQQIDEQADRRQRYRLVKCNRHWMEQSRDALIADEESDHCQDQGAGKCRQIAEFPGPEDETFVSRVTTSVGVGKGSDYECARVGRHVQPIRDE